eukprot:COSAG01_NODE_5122_length_4471_cov_2.591263_7_plen_90_part_00
MALEAGLSVGGLLSAPRLRPTVVGAAGTAGGALRVLRSEVRRPSPPHDMRQVGWFDWGFPYAVCQPCGRFLRWGFVPGHRLCFACMARR